ncbi:peptidoglycan-binding protein [Streptomyces coeruleoprunus]|uniref:Peptidoglycan-binding protein n=1 Tax=Streptomyces coeruleoprunus TaxID=285563 RepID=A0ABV9XGI5_9ACTN
MKSNEKATERSTRTYSGLSRRAGLALVTAALAGGLLAQAGVPAYADTASSSRAAAVAVAQTRTAQVPVLRQGSRGVDVATAQDLLSAAGRPVTADGDFGPRTTAAVKAFQQSRGLAADGAVGARTWEALAVTVQSGRRGAAVKAVQRQLVDNGARVAVDGEFGPATAAAVKAFQQAKGLAADGVVGARTWTALLAGGGGTVPPAPGKPGDASELRRRIVSVARGQIGVSEPNGCRVYLTSCKTTAWCAAFVSWTWRQAGLPKDAVPNTLVARGVGLWGQQRGQFHASHPKPGDIVVWGAPAMKTGGHVGIVVAVHADGRIDTVDGNYGDKVTLRRGINPKTATTRGHKISGYVSPRGA